MSARPSVAWNAGWTGEEVFEIRPCRWVGGKSAIWQRHAPGTGKPIFAKPHSVRQRRSIAEMRCTVCGEKTVAGERWWFALGEPTDGMWMTTEAPVHRGCADYALQICPHLRKLGREPTRMPSGYSIVASIVGGSEFAKTFGIDVGDRQVLGSLKLAWPL